MVRSDGLSGGICVRKLAVWVGLLCLRIRIGLALLLLICPALTAQQRSEAYTWESVETVAGGYITGILAHPKERNLFYVRTDIGGAYRRDSASGRWVPLLDFITGPDEFLLGVSALAVDPTDTERLYLATGEYTTPFGGDQARKGAVFRSIDRGRTFQRTDLPIELASNEPGRGADNRMTVDPDHPADVYLATPHDGLFRSRDYGETWAQLASFPVTSSTGSNGVFGISFFRRNGQTPLLFVAVMDTKTALYVSEDDGASWSRVDGQPTGLLANHLMVSGDSLYLSYGDKPGPRSMSDGAVWRYVVATKTWRDITPLKTSAEYPHGFAGLSADPQHPETLLASSMGTHFRDDIFRSTDGGRHWRSLTDVSVRDISREPHLAHEGQTKTVGWYMTALTIDPFDENHMMYGTGATLLETHDLTGADKGKVVHWNVGALGIEEYVVEKVISPPVGAHLLSAVEDGGGFRHDSLTRAPMSFSNPITGSSFALDFAGLKPEILIRSGTGKGGQVAYSRDGGVSWSPVNGTPKNKDGESPKTGGSVDLSADATTVVWAVHDRGFGVYWTRFDPSVDLFSARWQTSSFGSDHPSDAKIHADRVDPKIFYAYDRNSGRFYLSRDGGASFARVAEMARRGSVVPGDAAGTVWFVAGVGDKQGGLYLSLDFGQNFSPIATVQSAFALGFGKAMPGSTAARAIYLNGKIADTLGIFRSDDDAKTWTRINDDQHQYASIQSMTGDPRIAGRVYLGTGGRGIVYGEPRR